LHIFNVLQEDDKPFIEKIVKDIEAEDPKDRIIYREKIRAKKRAKKIKEKRHRLMQTLQRERGGAQLVLSDENESVSNDNTSDEVTEVSENEESRSTVTNSVTEDSVDSGTKKRKHRQEEEQSKSSSASNSAKKRKLDKLETVATQILQNRL